MATDRKRGQTPGRERGQTPKRGQALTELAVGMFALALVVSLLVSFTAVIIRGLDQQRTVRADAGRQALELQGEGVYCTASKNATVEVEPLAAEYIFGKESVNVREKVSLPPMGLK